MALMNFFANCKPSPPSLQQLRILPLPSPPSSFPSRQEPDAHALQSCSSSSSGTTRLCAVPQKEAPPIVSDENVPEGHKGLHGFLYGHSGADIHDADLKDVVFKEGEDDGSRILDLDGYVKSRAGFKFAGVYSVYDSHSILQYIGYSRNVVLSLRSHINRLGKEKCARVRALAYADPAMVTRSKLEEERKRWLSETDAPPPGNSFEKDLWDTSSGSAPSAVMSEVEKIEYEEKKLKLRKAMGENLYDDVAGEEDDAKARRLKLLQATEGDNWSAVIDGQTKSTLDQTRSAEIDEQAPEAVVSPFQNHKQSNEPEESKGLYSADTFELTLENVDMVLNDVRPYLIADGGNVEVVTVDNGVISLRLQGACGTCPSSTVTMKMGIERVLKEKFGDAFKEVVQVDQQQIGASVKAVDAHLEILRPAIHNYSGFVEVVSVGGGECKVKYKGPPPIGMGIQAAIKDKFPDITSVILLDA